LRKANEGSTIIQLNDAFFGLSCMHAYHGGIMVVLTAAQAFERETETQDVCGPRRPSVMAGTVPCGVARA
jgi:hypothetical protein